MFQIAQDNSIRLSRGDYVVFSCFINAGDKLTLRRYTLNADNEARKGDILYFAIMEPNHKFEDAIVKKTFTADSPTNEFGDTLIELKPEDTENLLTGLYYYTVKLQRFADDGSYYVDTIIPDRRFVIED